MKNKLFCSLLFTLIIGSLLVSCKPEVEVFESSKKIANATLIGTDSVRSGGIVSGANIKVVEYKFLSADKAIRTESTFGDGVYDATYSHNYNIFALDEHIDRIYNSAALLRIEIEQSIVAEIYPIMINIHEP